MADERNPLEPVTDDLFENALTFSQSSMKWATKVTLNAYRKFGYVAATVLPITLTVGGPTSISTQQSIRKPDEHLASQSQNSNAMLEAGRMFEVVTTTSDSRLSAHVFTRLSVSAEVVPAVKKEAKP